MQPLKSKEAVLIVDDEETSDIYLTEILGEYFDEVFHASNGIDAIEVCQKHNEIAVILMDIKMPKMDGLTATREIRKFNRDVIIIAQTAYAMISDRRDALKAGCNDYISKPIVEEKLIRMLNEHLTLEK